MKKIVLFLLCCFFTLMLFSCGTDEEESISVNEFSGPWIDDMSLSISKTLAQNKIKICGQYKYRESIKISGKYLVSCTRDGKIWHDFLVWPSTNSVKDYVP